MGLALQLSGRFGPDVDSTVLLAKMERKPLREWRKLLGLAHALRHSSWSRGARP